MQVVLIGWLKISANRGRGKNELPAGPRALNVRHLCAELALFTNRLRLSDVFLNGKTFLIAKARA